MSVMQAIADAFDLQRRSRLCNVSGCLSIPTKKVTLFEEARLTGKRKALATIFLCGQHYQTTMPLFLTEANTKAGPGKFIDKRVHEIGFITY
jgi:hypothetical protein